MAPEKNLTHLPTWVAFPIIVGASLVTSVAVSWLTAPVNQTLLIGFFRTVRPFGLWRPIRSASALSENERRAGSERPGIAIINVVLAMAVISGAYLCPMYLVGHWYAAALMSLGLVVGGGVLMKYTWYDRLPAAGED